MLIQGYQKTTLLDYPGKVASTVFTGGCNFRCPYCHNGHLVLNSHQEPAIPMETIITHLKKRQKVLEGVCISGGGTDATTRLDFFHSANKRNES